MLTELRHVIQQRSGNWSVVHSKSLANAQEQVMEIRRLGLAHIADQILRSISGTFPNEIGKTTALYDWTWLEEFATGDIVKCLGPEYAIYKNRRSPRIPNGDLLLMTRIMKIQGNRGDFNSISRIEAELDVPANAWFFDGVSSGEMPLSILMETALQPCGILSAWLGTQLRLPEVNFFFRNLDGEVRYLHKIDLRGKTIQARAVLTRTIFSGSTIIQHFEFELACCGKIFFEGISSFGYFPEDSMTSQNGLDGGKAIPPWGRIPENSNCLEKADLERLSLNSDFPSDKLRLIDEAFISKDGGFFSKGYAVASRRNSPKDWFYLNHFYQDPVMPGSLGIEAIVQALKVAVHSITGSDRPVTLAAGSGFKWKYRGQVLQNHQQMIVEVSILDQQLIQKQSVFTANASLWADETRIYELKNLAVIQD
jgi:3-hydroxymyristoyl/3-hydroxydecanoyl-(acyl carrier protein) dehydratase